MSRRTWPWAGGIAGVVVAAAAAALGYELGNSSALQLQSCIVLDPRPLAWLCEQFFYGGHPTAQEVKELNAVAGARFAFEAKDEAAARRQLKRYLDAGVDINAVDQRTKGIDDEAAPKLTALHGAVLGPHLMEVRLLLEFGASRQVRDAAGRTAVDLARELHAKAPKPEREVVLRLLESGARPQ